MSGIYTLSEGVSLPYFVSLISIDRAIDELKIAEQVSASLETKWSLKELFQREIDEERVVDDIVKGYLLDAKKLKFFNAMTIVLMPKGKDGQVKNIFTDDVDLPVPPIPWDAADQEDAQWDHENAKIANFNGVQYVKIGTSARLRWDSNRVLAVAVDGQHRLWALRTFREDKKFRGGNLRPSEQKTNIPVIFILLHPEVGFKNTQDQLDRSIRGVARELFTDLNKNAKTVDRARELILDDRSINARCVRTLITDTTAKDSEILIPLSLIRWQDDLNRFDSSYYINSLVHLDLLIKSLLRLKEPSDPLDESQVKSFIKGINSSLGIDGKDLEYEGYTLSDYYAEHYFDDEGQPQIPFTRLPEQYMNSAVEGFKSNFKPWLLQILLGFKPYKELLSYARQHNLIEGVFGQYHAQTSKHKLTIREQELAKDSDWFNREIKRHEENIQKIKRDKWAFKAIFQKAIVRLGRMVEFENKGQDPNLGNISDVVLFLNHLEELEVLNVYKPLDNEPYKLWTFIAVNPSNEKIKVAKAVEDRIFAIMCLWYFGMRKLKVDPEAHEFSQSPRKLLRFFSAERHKVDWPQCSDAYQKIYKGFNVATFFGREAEELTDKQKKDSILKRFAQVFKAGVYEYNLDKSQQLVDASEDIHDPEDI